MIIKTKKSESFFEKNMKEKPTDIEPRKEKKPQGTASIFQTFTQLFSGSIGPDIFAMGDCFKNGGFLGSMILLPLIAVIAVYCQSILINASVMAVKKTPDATVYDYPQTVEKCLEYGPKPLRRFSKPMKLIVEIFLCLTQFGFCSIFFIFITENICQVLVQSGVNLSGITIQSIILLPALLPSLVTNLDHIAPLSWISTFSEVFGLVATVIIILKDTSIQAMTEWHLTANDLQLSLFFGTALFCYEGISLVLPMRNSMKEPQKFTTRFGVLNITMFCVSLLYIFTGFLSYLHFGDKVQGSITLNLDPTNVFSQVTKVVVSLGFYLGYPIQFMVLITTIWVPMKQSCSCIQNYPIILEVLFRFFMILSTFGVAKIVPKLELFISLIGALCCTSLGFIIPILLDFVVKSEISKGLTAGTYFINIVILLVGVLGIITGVYHSMTKIIKEFKI